MSSRVDGRRLLDGGTNDDGSILSQISDGLGALRASAEQTVEGISSADVASGAVDPTTLSRKDQASLAIDGVVPGFFDAANPWSPAIDFGLDVTAAAAASNGLVFVIQANANTLATAFDKLAPPRFAFLWDDSVKDGSGVLDLDVTKPTLIVATVGPPKGTRLTLWCTDPSLTFTPIQQAPASQADAVRTQVFGAVTPPGPGLLDSLKAFLGGAVDVQKEGLIALVVVGGIVLYVLAKNTNINANVVG